jgi:hypothetical protein
MNRLDLTARLLLSLALGAAACVGARGEDPLGDTQFVASNALASTDYAPGAPTGGALPKAGTGPSAITPPTIAAGGGTGSVTPPPGQQPIAGNAPPPPRAGSGAAGSGAAGRTAAAGSSAAAGAPGAMGGATALPPEAGAPAPTGAVGMLTVDFKTVTSGGTYAPRNVGAVWIETGAGMFVKTLERWAGVRANHLSAWNAASGGWGSLFGGGNAADMMDAVSRATLRSHEMHHVTWNMKDAMGKVVPDGMYNLAIECTEDNFRAGPNGKVAFMKASSPQMVMAPDKAPFSGFVLKYQP